MRLKKRYRCVTSREDTRGSPAWSAGVFPPSCAKLQVTPHRRSCRDFIPATSAPSRNQRVKKPSQWQPNAVRRLSPAREEQISICRAQLHQRCAGRASLCWRGKGRGGRIATQTKKPDCVIQLASSLVAKEG